MVAPYTSPTKVARAIIVHMGPLNVDQVDGGSTPAPYTNLTDSVNVPQAEIGAATTSSFTHFDAGVMQAANYDEIVVDIQPTLKLNGSLLSVTTTGAQLDYNELGEAGKPFWITIRCDGYGIAGLQTRNLALSTAQQVMQTIWNDMINYQLSPNFQGFAFIQPDLNIVFPDLTVIDRLFQSTLVQACWTINRSACFITARPADSLTLVAPTLTKNINSNLALAHPIIGCNPAQRDKILILYPNLQTSGHNLSVVVGQIAATMSPTNRDPGFTLNLDIGYIIPIEDTEWTPDNSIGVTGVGNIELYLANICNFVAAMGITLVGVHGIPLAGVNIPAPIVFLPPDASVNTTGKCAVWGQDSFTYISYGSANGTVVRQFTTTFNEQTYTGPTPL